MVGFPCSLIAGETITARFSCEASAVSVTLLGPSKLVTPYTGTGDAWEVSIDTTALLPGAYAFEVWATAASGAKRVVERGSLAIQPALESLPAGTDSRSLAARMVDMIESMMAGNAAAGVKRYKINNRELERYSVAELIELLNYWKSRLAREKREASGAPRLGRRIAFRI